MKVILPLLFIGLGFALGLLVGEANRVSNTDPMLEEMNISTRTERISHIPDHLRTDLEKMTVRIYTERLLEKETK